MQNSAAQRAVLLRFRHLGGGQREAAGHVCAAARAVHRVWPPPVRRSQRLERRTGRRAADGGRAAPGAPAPRGRPGHVQSALPHAGPPSAFTAATAHMSSGAGPVPCWPSAPRLTTTAVISLDSALLGPCPRVARFRLVVNSRTAAGCVFSSRRHKAVFRACPVHVLLHVLLSVTTANCRMPVSRVHVPVEVH